MNQKYELIQKPLLSVTDIMTLCQVGHKRAKHIMATIEQVTNCRIINGLVPTSEVINVCRIDVDLIIKLTQS